MFTFLDPIEPLRLEWSAWSDLRATQPRFVAKLSGPDVNGHEVATRVGAIFAASAATVCGLRPWDDAIEGVDDDVAWVSFEAEKLARMMLHQSGLAFELLVSPRVWSDGVNGRAIVGAAATSGIVQYYRDVALPLASGRMSDEMWRWRSLLTGLLLARTGGVSLHLPTLLSHVNDADLEPLANSKPPAPAIAAKLLAEIEAAEPALPASVSNYDWLNDWVVTQRMSA